jgi:hypothetical protein
MNKNEFISVLENKLNSVNSSEGVFKNSIESIIYTYTISLMESKKSKEEIWDDYKEVFLYTCNKYLSSHDCRKRVEDLINNKKSIQKVLKKEIKNTLNYMKKKDDFAAYDSYLRYLESNVEMAKIQLDLLSLNYKEDFSNIVEFKELTNFVKIIYFEI